VNIIAPGWRKGGEVGHFDPVVPDGLGGLPAGAIPSLLLPDAGTGREFLSGVMKMTTSNYNRHSSSIDDTIAELGNSHSSAASALYYPSLAENCWDDELLPSGD